MAVAARRDDRMSVAEFRTWVEAKPDSERWELLDGVPVLMSPPCERHQMIVSNLLRRVADLAEQRGCRALPGLGILSSAMDDFAPIPDVVVRCGPIGPDGYASDPVLVAEVLPPSTMSRDRGRKVDFYLTVASLKQFLIVYQGEPRIELWYRSEVGSWATAIFGLDGAIPLPELGGVLRVADVYASIPF